MNKSSSLKNSSVVVDLSKFSAWEESRAELQSLIQTRRSFWGDVSLILRFADFAILEKEAEELDKLLKESNISVNQIQTNSTTSWKHLQEKGFEVNAIPAAKPISGGSSGIRLIKESRSVKQTVLETSLPPNSYEQKTIYIGLHENVALRSGNLISYDGNIVILGDVNPGCQIRATGSIIVFGKLCGSVHAGFAVNDEDEVQKLFVKALKMGDPLQISIGDYSACSSSENDKYSRHKIYPETARVIDGRIWRISDFE